MKEDFVTYDLAVKLKEKGFKEECLAYYTNNIDFFYNTTLDLEVVTGFKSFNSNLNGICWKRIDAPTISKVLKWLRKKYSIHISTKPYTCEDGIMWLYEIRKFNEYIIAVVANKTGFIKEEQANLAGIEYVIDNLI